MEVLRKIKLEHRILLDLFHYPESWKMRCSNLFSNKRFPAKSQEEEKDTPNILSNL